MSQIQRRMSGCDPYKTTGALLIHVKYGLLSIIDTIEKQLLKSCLTLPPTDILCIQPSFEK